MIRSMTGFGEAEESTEIGLVRIEVKTVNHRFFNLTLRMPPGLDGLQSEVQLWIRDFISRGHVTYTLTLDRGSISKDNILPQLDMGKAACYRDILDDLSNELDLKGDINLSHLIRFADIFKVSDTTDSSNELPNTTDTFGNIVAPLFCLLLVRYRYDPKSLQWVPKMWS